GVLCVPVLLGESGIWTGPVGIRAADMGVSMVSALTLDVGNTLIFPSPSLGHIYAGTARRHGLDLVPDAVEAAFRTHWQACQSRRQGLVYGTTHEEAIGFWCEVNRGIFAREQVPDGPLRTFVEDLYETFARPTSWRVDPDLPAVLAACRERDIRIGLISNWDLRLRPLLDGLGFTAWADPILISAEHGIEKPDPRLFQRAVQALAVAPEQVLHVGDTWREDVEAARACGIRAAWLARDGNGPPEHNGEVVVLQTLGEIVPILAAAG
ncbi:MAG: HAD-IA family hydrolase, partial [Lentisphaeria bacterium]|nr:HAD-IA family hydrolase [Lentisphaeria bacterium]